MDFSSKLLENAVYEIAQLPSIGKRTALRLALHLLKQPEEQSLQLAQAIVALRTHIQYCKNCHNISDVDLCEICANPMRDTGVVGVLLNINFLNGKLKKRPIKGHNSLVSITS